jgi:hypothetical protein
MPAAMLAVGLFLISLGLTPLLALLGITNSKRPACYRWLLAIGGAGTAATQLRSQYIINQTFGLPVRWALTAPSGWIAFGMLVLDALRVARGGKGSGWKGRPVIRLEPTEQNKHV